MRPRSPRARPRVRAGPQLRRNLDGAITEAEWQQQVEQIAASFGFWCYHTHDSRRSQPGWPDLVCLRKEDDGTTRMIVAELKTDRGKLRPEQSYVLDLLRLVPHLEVYLWRPADLQDVTRILQPVASAPAVVDIAPATAQAAD